MTVLFYIFSTLLIYSALSVVLRRNPVVAVLHLVLAFASCAVLWLLMEAEFLAMSLILVYVGAVMVLFLFVIMMLEPNLARIRQTFTGKAPLGIFLSACLIGLFLISFRGEEVFVQPERIEPIQSSDYSNTYDLGWALFNDFLYPFELAGLVLLLAIVAAIYLSQRTRSDVRRQKPHKQIEVSKDDRLKIVKVDSALPSIEHSANTSSGAGAKDEHTSSGSETPGGAS